MCQTVDARRVHLMMKWVVSLSTLSRSRRDGASKLHREMATSRIEEVGTPRPHVAGRQFHARVGVVRHMIVVPQFNKTSFRPRVLLALVGLGGLLLCTLALFQLIPFLG